MQDQIDATIEDGIKRVRSKLPKGPGLSRCEECGVAIPKARRKAVPGVRLCVSCKEARDRVGGLGINRNCKLAGDRVELEGSCVFYLEGEVKI